MFHRLLVALCSRAQPVWTTVCYFQPAVGSLRSFSLGLAFTTALFLTRFALLNMEIHKRQKRSCYPDNPSKRQRFQPNVTLGFVLFCSFPCSEISHVALELHKRKSLTATLLLRWKHPMPSLVPLPAITAWFGFAPASPRKPFSSPANPNLQQCSHSRSASSMRGKMGWDTSKPHLTHSKRGYSREAGKGQLQLPLHGAGSGVGSLLVCVHIGT